MKNQRQQKIGELIEKYEIGTQEELIAKLAELGIVVTQTTVSRDIRDLKLVKVPSHGGYRYILPSREGDAKLVMNSAVTDSVISVEAAQNLIVIKTLPGMANAVAVCVEAMRESHIVGAVAGDDTVLLVMKDSDIAKSMENKLKSLLSL